MNNGEIFTGQLTNERKDGSKFLLEYKDGLVRSVKKLNGEEQVFEKTFSYNQNGQIRTISRNGKETAEFLYDEQGRKFVFRRFEDNMHYFFNKEGKLDHAIDMKKMNYYKDKMEQIITISFSIIRKLNISNFMLTTQLKQLMQPGSGIWTNLGQNNILN